MEIAYQCRHCGIEIGKIEQIPIHASQIGIDCLTEQERIEMIHYKNTGTIEIQAICEDCHEAYLRSPEFFQYEYLIQ